MLGIPEKRVVYIVLGRLSWLLGFVNGAEVASEEWRSLVLVWSVENECLPLVGDVVKGGVFVLIIVELD
ncbi:hypothetical protein Q1695_004129 [Nippostrongylus brasiliensis]|nr:hypothetical protein Q1695_004129 [Nippostrongylus brasiliensis]